MCVCRAGRHFENTSEDILYPAEEHDRDYDMHELLCYGAGQFASASFVYRREVSSEFPHDLYIEGVTDYTSLLYAGRIGKVRYLADVMCVHNDGVAGSWTVKNWDRLEKRLASDEKVIAMLERLDAMYEGKYHASVEEAIRLRRYYMAEAKYEQYLADGNTAAAKSGDCRPIWKERRKQALRKKLREALPGLAALKRKLKKHS